jgi:putative transposase
MAVRVKGAHVPKDLMRRGVRLCVAYPLSTRPVEALMQERGVSVDGATINRWVLKDSPRLEQAFHRRKPSVWPSLRLDDASILVKGPW